MTPFDAKKDRHEKLGQGLIGLEPLMRFIEHPVIRQLPILLESPYVLDGFAVEIKLIKERMGV
jgi:deoxyribonuclease-4